MPETFTDEDLGIGTLLSDEDVGLGEEAPPSLLDRIKQGALAGGFGALSKDPAKLALEQVAHSVSLPEMTGAMDTVKQAILSTAHGQTRSFQERLGEMPVRPPTTAEQIAAGVQNVAAENLTSPLALAFPVAGKFLSPAAAKSAAALFATQAAMQVPEAARRAGEASVSGTPFEKTVAYGNLGATLALPPLAALDVVRSRAKPKPESEVTSARENESSATVHGDVRSQSVEGVREVPIEEGSEGVQPQTKKGVQEGREVPELQRDVAADVPPEALEHPVQVEAPDGTRRTAFFNGYYDMPGMEPLVSVGYKLPNGHLSHGAVKPSQVIGKIPSLEEWKRSREEIKPADMVEKVGSMSPEQWQKWASSLHESGKGREATTRDLAKAAQEGGFVADLKAKADLILARRQAELKKAQSGPSPQKQLAHIERSGLLSDQAQFFNEAYQFARATVEAKTKAVPSETQPTIAGELVPSLGPGAASPKDIGTQSQITQLTQSIQNTASPKQPIGQRIQAAVKTAVGAVKAAPQTTGQAIKTGVQKLAAVTGAIKSGLTQLPVFTEFKRILGKWDGADQQAAHETRAFVQEINRRIPKDRQEAITNWIQAGGDPAVLQQRAAASTNPKLRKGYEDALTLNADEKVAAQNISNYLDSKLQDGLASGLLDHGLENYLNQVWKKPNPITLKLQADLATGKLQPNFKFARQRVFDHYFEGEQAGYVPANKSVGALIGIYDQAFNRALSGRAFIKNLTEGKAGDGRPLVATSGSAGLVPKGQPPEALLVRPKTKPEDTGDYKVIDHPALRKWMWQTQTPEGTPVMVQGDLLVHPEIYQHLKNVLGKSAWRQNKLGRAILGTEATIKQTMFSASGFHQVQETLHALGHQVNPTNLSDIDFNNPVHKEAVEHGLQLASYDAMEQFTDGLGSGPLINKIPLIGKRLLGPYTEWLFQDYIPRLKITMYEHALGRNAERYQDQIASGKMTKDQLLELTAKQANAAFGEQNYNWIGRNKTVQDSLRAFIVAPDFLEARAKFVGQALRPHGREQLVALGLLAATQYITARILNKAIDDDYHFDKPFSLVAGKHEYELRTIPGDIAHLIKDPKKFATSRLAPIARQGVEFITGRDYRGVKRDTLDQIKDFAKLPTPISMRRQDDQRWWETFLNAFGVHERSATASQEIADKARQFREKVKGKADVEILEGNESPYRKLRVSLDVGNEKASLQALQELRKTHPDSRILSTMQSHIRHPFTGSATLEHKFKQSLEPVELKKYQEAMVERKERYQKFKQLWVKRGQKPSAQASLKEPQALTDEDVGL